jgi:hypothetical protein
MTLQERFTKLRLTDSSINEHLETLRRYAQSSDVVCELGVDIGQSTTAFLMGQPGHLFSFDLVMKPELEELFSIARFSKTCPNRTESIIGDTFWVFNCPWDTSKLAVPTCDLLFIDTWHSYPQLAAELALNHERARKWIVLHDTISFAACGEGWQDWEADGKGELKGIGFAMQDFLDAHPEWIMKEHYNNNNGLTILGRKL